MVHVQSFPPIAQKKSRVMILGTMPGVASLEAHQYYAHPRNSFWPIMNILVGADISLPYAQRIKIIRESGIGLWEVLQSCYRPGSLDSSIEKEVPNDFNVFLSRHPSVTHLFFNGAKAEQSFRKLIMPTLKTDPVLIRLPSTSPAHAGLKFKDKLAAWMIVGEILRQN